MQGTIATFDPGTRSGTLLLDDGSELAFGAQAFDRSGLRLLRLGQRVSIDAEADGAVNRVSIPGID
jgi:cold shock CspA family protein